LADFVEGVVDYSKAGANWTFTTSPAWSGGFPETFAMSMKSLRGWHGDGAIAVITREQDAEVARDLGFPVVNLAGTMKDRCGVARVMVDHEEIGRVAARHFLAKGFRRFAYYGAGDTYYGELRQTGFSNVLREAGYDLDHVFHAPARTDPDMPWIETLDQLGEWLSGLPKPIAVLAVNDYRACLVVEQCERMAIRIPQQVALLGVDDDNVICEHCHPPLSSVSRNGRQVGYQAAALLDRLIRKETPPEDEILVAPGTVVQRDSTDVMATEHPHVAAAVQLIHDNLGRSFGVNNLLRELGVSRRFLERHFRQELGCSPHEYLTQQRIEKAKRLIEHRSDLSIQEIATACGQSDPRNFRRSFQRLTGLLPSEFRERVAESPGKSP
jgi:LacI family transcriptional regulator